MSWDVRGLGDSDKCITVRDAILAASPTVVCLQESKLEDISSFKAKAFLPFKIATTFQFAPSSGARGYGRMVTVWDQSALTPTNKIEKAYTLTTTFSQMTDIELTVTNVYAPADHRHSNAFFSELAELTPNITGPWVLIGDFNPTRTADETVIVALLISSFLQNITFNITDNEDFGQNYIFFVSCSPIIS